jgi:hypothetical protein
MYNHVTVEMPNSQWQFKRVYKASFRQQNYEHDYLRITFRDWDVTPTKAKPGSLIRVTLDGKEFCGYIHDLKNRQENGKDMTEIGVIGASYVMRQASQKVYREVTADQVIVEIAKRYGFAYKVVPHSRVYPQISQAGLTDWELMVKLAKQSGYFLRAENAAIYFQPLLQDFKEMVYEAKSFTKTQMGKKYTSPLYSFRPVIGETLAHHGSDKSAVSVAGIDPLTGEYFKYTRQARSETTRSVSHPELFDKHATHVVANDYKTAVSEANAADDKSTFPYVAEVEIVGTPSLRPGAPVHLANVGPEYSGYWTILQVEHVVKEESLNKQSFTTRLFVGSDSLGSISDPAVPVMPKGRPARRIVPNTKNTRKKVVTEVFWSGLNIKQPNSFALVSRTNRSNIESSTLLQSRWISKDGNLVTIIEDTYVPEHIREKIRSYNARS